MVYDIENAYILAGGQSRRMGYDKLMNDCVDGMTLVQRTLTTCRRHFRWVKLVGKCTQQFRGIDSEMVFDFEGAEGPLAGVIAALQDCSLSACFVTAADLFDLDSTIVNKLLEEYSGEQYLGLQESGAPQPLCGIYNKSALPVLIKHAEMSVYRMQDAVAAFESVRLLPVVGERWRNINEPTDWAEIGGASV